ncbi:hypothetical protein MMC26_003504 [Xylographa opegraphella]|nr:hypothetical protein [Xylographa opegraphella]
MTAASAVQIPDILILILSFLDPTTLASFRRTSLPINSVIIAHQRLICNSIALHTYSISLDFLPSPKFLPFSSGLRYLHFNALWRIPRVLLLADRAVNGSASKDSPTHEDTQARCTRGLLVFWALIDIQESVSPQQVPVSNFGLEQSVAPRPVPTRWKQAAHLFSPRTWVSTLRSPSIDPHAITPPVQTANTSPVKFEDSRCTSWVPSAAAVARRFADVKAAQAPFVALLARPTRIDLEVAQGFLHSLMPNTNFGSQPNSPLYLAQHCWWRESWALRQGPAFMIAVSSTDARERAWTNRKMEQEFMARSRDVVEVERTTPIFLFEDNEMMENNGTKPLWVEAWEVRAGRLGV